VPNLTKRCNTVRHRFNIYAGAGNLLVLPAMTRRWAPQTRYTHASA